MAVSTPIDVPESCLAIAKRPENGKGRFFLWYGRRYCRGFDIISRWSMLPR